MPHSPCGNGCLATPTPSVSRARTIARLVSAALVMVAGLGVAASLPPLSRRGRHRLVAGWCRALLAAFEVRLEVHGPRRFQPSAVHPAALAPAATADEVGRHHTRRRRHSGPGVLVACNHVSWLDIIAVDAVQPTRMLAKRDIRDWPLVGRLASRAGTVFVDRERLSALPATVDELASVLRAGGTVGVFPEGTTWCGLATGRFRGASFQAALDARTAVRPVALRYRLADGTPTTAAAFVGEATLWSSIRRVAGVRGLVVEVHVLPALPAGRATDRRELAALTELSVNAVRHSVELSVECCHSAAARPLSAVAPSGSAVA